MDFKTSLKHFSLPENLVQMDTKDSMFIPYQEYLDRVEKDDVSVKDLVPVINNATWIAKTPSGGYYSSDGVEIVHVPKDKAVIVFQEKGEHGLVTREFKTPKPNLNERVQVFEKIKNHREESNMELKGLDGLNLAGLGGMQEMAGSSNVAKMDVNREAAAQNVSAPKVDTVTAAKSPIQRNMNETQMIEFNRAHGALHCIITKADHKTYYGTAKVASAKSKTVTGAGADRRNHGSAAASAVEGTASQKQLVLKDAKPTPIVGAIISMPIGGMFTSRELSSGQMSDGAGNYVPLKVDTSRKDVKYVLLEKDEFAFRVLNSFGFAIREDRETYGDSCGEIQVRLTNKVCKDGTEKTVTRFKAPKGRSLVVDGAYFPLKTYDYLEPTPDSTQADIDLLNFSAFYHLFKSKAATSPHQTLIASDASKINRDAAEKMTINGLQVDKITSSMYDIKGGTEALACRKWNGGPNDVYSSVKIPAKAAVENKNHEINARIITCDCIKDVDKPYYERLASLKDPKFANLVSRFGEYLNREQLQATFRATNTKSNQERIAADNQTFRLLAEFNAGVSSKFTDSIEKLVMLNR